MKNIGKHFLILYIIVLLLSILALLSGNALDSTHIAGVFILALLVTIPLSLIYELLHHLALGKRLKGIQMNYWGLIFAIILLVVSIIAIVQVSNFNPGRNPSADELNSIAFFPSLSTLLFIPVLVVNIASTVKEPRKAMGISSICISIVAGILTFLSMAGLLLSAIG